MSNPVLVLVCGCSGAGKTTFAKEFAKREGLKYFGADEFYEKVNGSDLIRKGKFEVWVELFRAIHEAEMQGVSCLVDSNTLKESARSEFLNWFPGFDHHIIYFEADYEVRKRNVMQRKRTIPEKILLKMGADAEPPSWNTLDKRWLSMVKIMNINNQLQVVDAKGEIIYESFENVYC